MQKANLLICAKCKFHFYINPLVCNAVIIENEKGEILLVKRKYAPKKDYWDWPGGFIEPEEDLDESVKREIKEELGVEIEIQKIVGVYKGDYEYQKILYPSIGIAVSARILTGEIKPTDDISAFKYFKPAEIFTMELAFEFIKNGIKDYLKTK